MSDNKKKQRQDQSKVQTQPVTPAPRRDDRADNAPSPGSREPQQANQGPARPQQDGFDRQPNRRDEGPNDKPNDDDELQSETERQIRPRK